MKQSEIILKVLTDENNVPEKITWSAPDGGVDSEVSKAFMFSAWDEKEQNAFRIDLWTKDMTVDEMKLFIFQTMSTMADTFERATNEDEMAADMRDFCHYFAEKMDIITPEDE